MERDRNRKTMGEREKERERGGGERERERAGKNLKELDPCSSLVSIIVMCIVVILS